MLMDQEIDQMTEKTLVQHTSAGEPINIGDLNIYPVSRTYRFNFPGTNGGISWNRPLGVIVEDQLGNRQVLPVKDVTRRYQISILSAGFLATLLTWLVLKRFNSPKQIKENSING
jgi:hypothetical protein